MILLRTFLLILSIFITYLLLPFNTLAIDKCIDNIPDTKGDTHATDKCIENLISTNGYTPDDILAAENILTTNKYIDKITCYY